MKSLTQKYPTKELLVPNLGIFAFLQNFTVIQIRGCSFQIWQFFVNLYPKNTKLRHFCVTFQKLHFFTFFYSKCVVFVDDISQSGSNFQNLKNYPLAAPVVVWVLFLIDALWVTKHSDHADENVSHILSLSYFFNQHHFCHFVIFEYFLRYPGDRFSTWKVVILWVTFSSTF